MMDHGGNGYFYSSPIASSAFDEDAQAVTTLSGSCTESSSGSSSRLAHDSVSDRRCVAPALNLKGLVDSPPIGLTSNHSNEMSVNPLSDVELQVAPPTDRCHTTACTSAAAGQDEDGGDAHLEEPIDLQIRNVVTCFNVYAHIDLRRLAMHAAHAIYERGSGVVQLQLRHPRCYVKVWTSGKASTVGSKSEHEALLASRKVARLLQKLFPSAKFCDYRVTNIMATCSLPFGVRIQQVSEEIVETSYEPELNVGLLWRVTEPKMTLRIHTTGSVTVTGAVSTADILTVLERVYPVLARFKAPKGNLSDETVKPKKKRKLRMPKDHTDALQFSDEEFDSEFDEEEELYY